VKISQTRLQVDIVRAADGFRYTVREMLVNSGKCCRVHLNGVCETRRDAEIESGGAVKYLAKQKPLVWDENGNYK